MGDRHPVSGTSIAARWSPAQQEAEPTWAHILQCDTLTCNWLRAHCYRNRHGETEIIEDKLLSRSFPQVTLVT